MGESVLDYDVVGSLWSAQDDDLDDVVVLS